MADPTVIQIDKYLVIASPLVTEEYQKKYKKLYPLFNRTAQIIG
jgi:hypothetical protein